MLMELFCILQIGLDIGFIMVFYYVVDSLLQLERWE